MQPPLKSTAVINLLNAIMVNPTFTTNDPSPDFLQLLERIENADPDAFADDEDNLGSSWGHYQFSAGSLTLTRVIISWASVGSPSYACRLIAAAITTSNVARWLCRNHPQVPCFISDDYLASAGELLWEYWKSAGGVSLIICNVTCATSDNFVHIAPGKR